MSMTKVATCSWSLFRWLSYWHLCFNGHQAPCISASRIWGNSRSESSVIWLHRWGSELDLTSSGMTPCLIDRIIFVLDSLFFQPTWYVIVHLEGPQHYHRLLQNFFVEKFHLQRALALANFDCADEQDPRSWRSNVHIRQGGTIALKEAFLPGGTRKVEQVPTVAGPCGDGLESSECAQISRR